MNQYPIPSAPVISKEEIKKSRFITYLAHTPGADAAHAFIQNIKNEHAAARHNCWAFVAGAPNDSMRLGFSDDGEPSGTAGKPILAQLQGAGIGEITAVVTRYSGGIKLGTGGLVSAYGGGVGKALEVINTELKVLKSKLCLLFDYSDQKVVDHLLQSFDASIIAANYLASVELIIEVVTADVQAFKDKLAAHDKSGIRIIVNR